jgi:hypothetical protein
MDAEHRFIETLIISETWWKCIFVKHIMRGGCTIRTWNNYALSLKDLAER